jgi:ABC-2 type transport system permease protein
LKIGRYPLDIFQGFLKIFLIYFLPLVFIAQIPAQALLGMLSPAKILSVFIVTAAFLCVSLVFWMMGLKNYLSAST